MTANSIERTRGRGDRATPEYAGRVSRPAVDMIERDDEIVVLADAPGLSLEGIEITVEGGLLTFHGRVDPKTRLSGRADGRPLALEYEVGDWRRTFRLGEEVDVDGIGAEYRDGVLSIRLPKVEAKRPRRIGVVAHGPEPRTLDVDAKTKA